MTAPNKATQQLMTDNQGLVRSLAKRIHRGLPSYVELEDLVAYGQMGLAEAAKSFDATRGHQFSTFAYYRIRGAIYDGLGKMNWFNRSQYEQARSQQLASDVLTVEADAQSEPGDSLNDEVRWLKRATSTLGVGFLNCTAGIVCISISKRQPRSSMLASASNACGRLGSEIISLPPGARFLRKIGSSQACIPRS